MKNCSHCGNCDVCRRHKKIVGTADQARDKDIKTITTAIGYDK